MDDYFLWIKDPECYEYAVQLANFTQKIQIVTTIPEADTYLMLGNNGLVIVNKQFEPLFVEDIYRKQITRYHNLSQELLIQVVNLKPALDVVIFDLTAGLAKDASLLAYYGFSVTMVERNPLLATILYDALSKQYLPANLNLVYAESAAFLAAYRGPLPQIIYLDPMFKESKQAKAKKEMQLIQDVARENNGDDNLDQLFSLALATATKRLIVKRDNKQSALVANPKPSYSRQGKTVRYDVYVS